MNEMVFLLEERSARAMLEGFLPKIIPAEWRPRYIVFEGKQDLEQEMVRKIRGYRTPGARFVVLRDQDAAACETVKRGLAGKCAEAGKSASEALTRVACHELESWYLADLAAVETGLGVPGLARQQGRHPYRSPDALPNPSQKLSQIAPVYQKVGGSRAIGPHLDPENKRSTSFHHFVEGLRKLSGQAASPAR